MSQNVVIIDNNLLSQLYSAGGQNAWNSLLASGNTIIITDVVYREATFVGSPYSEQFEQFYDRNAAKFEFRNINIDDVNAYRASQGNSPISIGARQYPILRIPG